MTVVQLPPTRETTPRSFLAVRIEDVSNVSGVGVVAEGTEWTDGSCTVRWRGDNPMTQHCDGGIESWLKVHGHGGKTYIKFLDDPDIQVVYPDSFQRPRGGRTLAARRQP